MPSAVQWVVKANFQKRLIICPELKAKNLSNEETLLESDLITNRLSRNLHVKKRRTLSSSFGKVDAIALSFFRDTIMKK